MSVLPPSGGSLVRKRSYLADLPHLLLTAPFSLNILQSSWQQRNTSTPLLSSRGLASLEGK